MLEEHNRHGNCVCGYSEKVDVAKLAERFAVCTRGNWEDFIALNAFDETPGISKKNMEESNPSFLLWQDAAALMAGVGSAVYASFEEAIQVLTAQDSQVYAPDPLRHAQYRSIFENGFSRFRPLLLDYDIWLNQQSKS